MALKNESRLGGSPLSGMDLLSSTVDAVKEPVEKTPKANKDVPGKKVAAVKPKAVKKTKTDIKPESAAGESPAKELEVVNSTPSITAFSPGDQYGYEKTIKWPLLSDVDPYLIPVPQSGDKIPSTAFSLRLSLDLDLTIEAHTKNLRVNKSEWIRAAMLRQLEQEQEILRNIQHK